MKNKGKQKKLNTCRQRITQRNTRIRWQSSINWASGAYAKSNFRRRPGIEKVYRKQAQELKKKHHPKLVATESKRTKTPKIKKVTAKTEPGKHPGSQTQQKKATAKTSKSRSRSENKLNAKTKSIKKEMTQASRYSERSIWQIKQKAIDRIRKSLQETANSIHSDMRKQRKKPKAEGTKQAEKAVKSRSSKEFVHPAETEVTNDVR